MRKQVSQTRKPVVKKSTANTVTIQNQPDNQKLYTNFKEKEKDMLAKTGVLLSSVYYLLDHKAIAYKLECDLEYLMTFLNKREDNSRADSIHLIHKLCVNQDVQNLLLKEQNFQYLVELSTTNKLEDIRSGCFKIFSSIALMNPSKQVVKQMFFKSNLIQIVKQRLNNEQSEDVRCSILELLMKLTTDEIYLELITEDLSVILEIIKILNHKKNIRLKRLAYAITVNLLSEEELRKSLMRQNQVDVIAKLISILQTYAVDQQKNSINKLTSEEVIYSLRALSNSMQDNVLFIQFLQQKGHIALADVFEDEDLRIKEACLCLYTRLAQDKDNSIQIVLESDLIYDVLSLGCQDKDNQGVIRNMLLLISVMITTNNEKAIEQMKLFDIINLLLHILSDSIELSYLALINLGLLIKFEEFKQRLLDRNIQYGMIDTIMKAIRNLQSDRNTIQYKYLMRGIQILLLSFEEYEDNYLERDKMITLVQLLNDEFENIEDPTTQYYH
ncbi:UNKNOWN [Stylonychia lemnae]|uniref:Uncharacterized protein n=1 Tax=Stylonychia lemnae TaxID=5949 RepID=A0A078B6V6_STYLE|nr:UNKNOWN [Stylonychia lemnae]|eukprot:CDW90119.1 UNKNOWN [Stylonychia lemnae]